MIPCFENFMPRSPEMGIAESLAGLHRALERAEEFHKKLQAYYEVGLRRKGSYQQGTALRRSVLFYRFIR